MSNEGGPRARKGNSSGPGSDADLDHARVDPEDPATDDGLESTLNAGADSLFFGGGALESPLVGDLLEALGDDSIAELGSYRLLERIGAGGMGEVWRAEQLEPVRRDVAVKLIRLGMDSAEVLGRFQAEQQALARMDHGNVARVFDAGVSEDGRPYFVMELIQGSPLVEFCDRRRLSILERLELFLGILAGVEHAHQKGIIHRDLKPSNILVTLEADMAVPKIIDFGIAKAVGEPLGGRAARTRLGQWIGTPEYMSPEQAATGHQDVDTRSDVYSLGTILYEILVGVRPFDGASFRSGDPAELRRLIELSDPQKPSERLSSQGPAQSDGAKRQADKRQLIRTLRGDLDWIVMKALEKDPGRRYASAREFSQDIRRYLESEPVLARAPSVSYRVQKFVRRHRLPVFSAFLIAAALLVGTALATAGLVRARDAEKVALGEAAKAREINSFLRDILSSARPEGGEGRDVTVVDALHRAHERVRTSFEGAPEVGADLREVIGATFHELGLYEDALPLLEESLEMRREIFGTEHTETASTLNELARLQHSAGNLQDAETYFLETLSVLRASGGKPGHIAATLNNLGMLYVHSGKFGQAKESLEAALEMKLELFGEEDNEVLPTLNNLGMLLGDMGEHREAEVYLRRALAGNRALHGQDHALVAINMNNLAHNLSDQGRFDEAIELFQETLQAKEKAFGADHSSYGITLAGLARVLDQAERYDVAGQYHLQALAVYGLSLSSSSFRVGAARSQYGYHLSKTGSDDLAREHLEEGHRILRETLGADHPRTLRAAQLLSEFTNENSG